MANTSKEIKNQEVQVEVVNAADVVTTLSPTIFEQQTQALFSSIQGTDRATKIKVYNAISNAEHAISDMLKEEIIVQDLVAHPIKLVDETTGELLEAMRVVLLSPDGVGYHSVSSGVVDSIQRIIGIVGPAPWNEPLTIVPTEVKTRRGFKTITLTLKG